VRKGENDIFQPSCVARERSIGTEYVATTDLLGFWRGDFLTSVISVPIPSFVNISSSSAWGTRPSDDVDLGRSLTSGLRSRTWSWQHAAARWCLVDQVLDLLFY